MIFFNGCIHTLRTEDETFYGFEVKDGMITRMFKYPSELPKEGKERKINLDGVHVYPAFIMFAESLPVPEEEYRAFCAEKGIGLTFLKNAGGTEKLVPEVRNSTETVKECYRKGTDPLSELVRLRKEEGTEPFHAMRIFTKDAARETGDGTRGVLYTGMRADFFSSPLEWGSLSVKEADFFEPLRTYIGGEELKKYEEKKGLSFFLKRLFWQVV